MPCTYTLYCAVATMYIRITGRSFLANGELYTSVLTLEKMVQFCFHKQLLLVCTTLPLNLLYIILNSLLSFHQNSFPCGELS